MPDRITVTLADPEALLEVLTWAARELEDRARETEDEAAGPHPALGEPDEELLEDADRLRTYAAAARAGARELGELVADRIAPAEEEPDRADL